MCIAGLEDRCQADQSSGDFKVYSQNNNIAWDNRDHSLIAKAQFNCIAGNALDLLSSKVSLMQCPVSILYVTKIGQIT